MKVFQPKKIILQIVKATALFLLISGALLYILPIYFSDTITKKVQSIANEKLESEIQFNSIHISFFQHFPSLTIALVDVKLKGSKPFEKKDLLTAKTIALGINVGSLLTDHMTFDAVYIENGNINVQVDKLGHANYNIYKSVSNDTPAPSNEESGLKINKIIFIDTDLTYKDLSIPVAINLKKLNYLGQGDLTSSIFDLKTHADIGSFDFNLDGVNYLQSKPVQADLITRINTESLSLIFSKNDLKIKNLPLSFEGHFDILKNGYELDFNLKTKHATLQEIVSLLPPTYDHWIQDTKMSGNTEIQVSLKGKHIANENISPDLKVHVEISEGTIAHKGITDPIKNLRLVGDIQLPQLHMDSLKVQMDTLHFLLGNGFFDARAKTQGIEPVWISGQMNTKLNLQAFDDAIGLSKFDIRGNLELALQAEGQYTTGIQKSGLRQRKQVITSIPKFNLKSKLTNGYIKLNELPEGVDRIAFNLDAHAKDGIWENVYFTMSNINAEVKDNFVRGKISVGNLKNFPIDANFQAKLSLAEIQHFYPIDSVELKGDLNVDFKAAGTYEPAKHLFPRTQSSLELKNGYVKYLLYPTLPIEKINVQTLVSSPRGSFRDLSIQVLPIRFEIAGEPFYLDANLNNFDNLKYRVHSKGSLDLGKIYQLFALDGLNVAGKIKSNFSIKGLQNDVQEGNYDKMSSRGTLQIEKMRFDTDLFPKPYLIQNGLFKFFKEKMIFESFEGSYGSTQFTANGSLLNVLPYMLTQKGQLEGMFTFSSPSLNVNEFMAYAPAASAKNASASNAGVVMLPDQTKIAFKATIKEIIYDTTKLKNFTGIVKTNGNMLELDSTTFEIAGAKVLMKGKYEPVKPQKALFDYNIQAHNFDIQSAYHEIEIFRELATSAKNIHGAVSLDYNLSGRLDANMQPVMPSLQGEGTFTLENIQFKGFKLLNSISKATDKKDLSNATASNVPIFSKIQNNVITIGKTKMRMAGFRQRFEGQVTFDGDINLGFRLGLPPFGIIGIPMTITGNTENYKVKIGKYLQQDLDKLDADEEE